MCANDDKNLHGLSVDNLNQNSANNSDAKLELGRSSREQKVSSKLKDYVCNTVWKSITKLHSSSTLPTSSAPQGKYLYPLTNYLTCDQLCDCYKHFLAFVTIRIEPT